MAGPTRARVYGGTLEQQQQACMDDCVEAAKYGWEPLSFEWAPGSMRVTFQQRSVDVPPRGVPAPDLRAEAPADVPRTRNVRPWEPVIGGVLLGALILAVWAVFAYKPAPAAVGVQPSVVGPAIVHCLPAGAALMGTIEGGLNVLGGGGLRDGRTVKTRDHAEIYFVAARITGTGMDGVVGLWATTDLSGEGPIYSVDRTAKAYSVWPDGSTSDLHLSQLDDGGDVAVACADG